MCTVLADPSAMMYAKAFKWVLEDRPYVGCEFRLSSLGECAIVHALSPSSECREPFERERTEKRLLTLTHDVDIAVPSRG